MKLNARVDGRELTIYVRKEEDYPDRRPCRYCGEVKEGEDSVGVESYYVEQVIDHTVRINPDTVLMGRITRLVNRTMLPKIPVCTLCLKDHEAAQDLAARKRGVEVEFGE